MLYSRPFAPKKRHSDQAGSAQSRMPRRLAGACLRLEELENRCLLSGITKVQDLGTGSTSSDPTKPSIMIPITSPAGVTAGDSVIVQVAVSVSELGGGVLAGLLTISVSDSTGNIYHEDLNETDLLVFSANNIKAIATGGSIVVNISGPIHFGAGSVIHFGAASATEFSGLAPVAPVDQTSSATGTIAQVSSGATGLTSQADELVLGAVASVVASSGEAPPMPDFAPGSNYAILSKASSSGVLGIGHDFIGTTTLDSEYQVTTAQGHYAADGVLSGGLNLLSWNAAVVTYRAVAAPKITSVSPYWATAGSAGFTLTVTGADFASNSVVQWNNTPLPTTYVSSTELEAAVPGRMVATAGPAYVIVSTPASGTSNLKGFLVLPREVLASPMSGPSSQLFYVDSKQALQLYDGSGWRTIGGPGSILGVSAVADTAGNVTAFAVTTDHALFEYDARGWHQLGAKDTILYVSAGLDENGRPDAWILTGDTSLTRWGASSGWYQSPVGAPDTVAVARAGTDGGVYVITSDGREASFSVANISFRVIQEGWQNGNAPYAYRDVQVAEFGPGIFGTESEIFSITPNNTLQESQAGYESDRINPSLAIGVESVSAGLQSAFWLTTTGQLVRYPYNTAVQVSLNPPSTVRDFAAATLDRVFALMADGSVWQHDDASGWIVIPPPSA